MISGHYQRDLIDQLIEGCDRRAEMRKLGSALVFNCIFYFPYILDLKASYMVDRFTEISPISAMI